jgi:hypothetical protein
MFHFLKHNTSLHNKAVMFYGAYIGQELSPELVLDFSFTIEQMSSAWAMLETLFPNWDRSSTRERVGEQQVAMLQHTGPTCSWTHNLRFLDIFRLLVDVAMTFPLRCQSVTF